MTMLASCDKIEADLPSNIGNDKILNISDDIDANTIQDIYDALITSGNTNSEKVLNNILYLYAKSTFGSFFSEGETKGLKDVVATYLASTSNTTEIDSFINAHKALQVKKDGKVDYASSRARVTNVYKDILFRIYNTFLGYVTNSTYQERNQFNEEKFYDAQLKNYYTLGEDCFENFIQVEGDMAIDEENPGEIDGLNNAIINKYFKNIWGTYQEYIELNILPDIYRNELTTEYMYTQNDAQINLTAAREVEYINLSANAQYTDAVLKLMRQYCAQVIEKGKMGEYGFEFLSALYKGADKELNDLAGTSERSKLAKAIYAAAGWTHASIDVAGRGTVNYYKESSFGTNCEKYKTVINQTSRDDSNANSVYSDFTNSGAYSKETGFKIKENTLIAEGHTTKGWYTSGGLSSLPSSLNTRIFKAAVANEVDNTELINETNPKGYKGGNGTYGRYIEGNYFLTPAAYSEVNNFPYLVEDGTNYYIVLVKEATKSAKFQENGVYDTRSVLEGERIARKVAYSLSSIDTWKNDAKTYYVQQMAMMYHDDYVYEYFKSQFPDLFE